MKTSLCASLVALSLLAPAAVARPLAVPTPCVVDHSLETLRAGRSAAPLSLAAEERTELRAAAARGLDLQELRAGELTDHEWTMIGIGAAIVLILVLI